VRPHAGKHRSSEYGTEFLSFGPNRSLPRAQVPEAWPASSPSCRRALLPSMRI
jgi:hypothetical protein